MEQEMVTTPRSQKTEENSASEASCDPEALIECPFDKSHQIRYKRFACHYLRCVKNHPELARVMRVCPYNARHVIHITKMMSHISMCENRPSEDQGDLSHKPPRWQVPIPTMASRKMEEDWEQEVDESAPPFIWGLNTFVSKK